MIDKCTYLFRFTVYDEICKVQHMYNKEK